MTRSEVYLDYAATAPLHPVAREALLAAYDGGWADPSRLYGAARRARLLLDGAREQVAGLLGVRPDELSFTSSGTQSVQLGLGGALLGRRRTGRHLVTTSVEHSSVLAVAEQLEAAGGTVDRLPVARSGRVDPQAVVAALRPDTAVVSVQHANHEVGTVQPIAEIATACAAHGVPLHVDAAQTVGRLPVRMPELGAQLLSASAHKWGGPPGVGLLVVGKGVRWRSIVPGDGREGGRVPGFENLPAVVAAAASLEARLAETAAENDRLSRLVDRVRAEIPRLVDDVEVVGDAVQRLPHLVTFSSLYVDGEALLTGLDRRGIAVSSGSSCSASTLRPSHVLEAMGVLTHGNVRVSLGRETTEADVDALLSAVPEVVTDLRELTHVQGL